MTDRDGTEDAERAIVATLVGYCRRIDDRRFDRVVDLFTSDARLHTMGRTYEGHDEIRALFGPPLDERPERPESAHVLSNVVAEVDGDGASVESDWMMLARNESGATTIALAGRYRDRMLCVGAVWLIAERTVVALARPAASSGAVTG